MARNNSGFYRAGILPVALTCLSACAGNDLPTASNPPQEPMPPYQALIKEALTVRPSNSLNPEDKGDAAPLPRNWELKNPEQYAPFEISEAIQASSIHGWSWLVCLKGMTQGRPVYFAVFIKQNAIVEIRGNVAIDNCPQKKYEPFAVNLPSATPWEFRLVPPTTPKPNAPRR
jgi:hypothetical protein